MKLLAFPELAITGATCGHLYYQKPLLNAALECLGEIADATRGSDMLAVVGLPLLCANGAVYSAAAAVCQGEVLGFTARRNVRGTVFASLAPGRVHRHRPRVLRLLLPREQRRSSARTP